ncbi:MAG: hypothetical protein JKY88_00605 [Pseudomonadales bacterium]|nr:hypothetical protein [Pseudomonadales bacterium]
MSPTRPLRLQPPVVVILSLTTLPRESSGVLTQLERNKRITEAARSAQKGAVLLEIHGD